MSEQPSPTQRGGPSSAAPPVTGEEPAEWIVHLTGDPDAEPRLVTSWTGQRASGECLTVALVRDGVEKQTDGLVETRSVTGRSTRGHLLDDAVRALGYTLGLLERVPVDEETAHERLRDDAPAWYGAYQDWRDGLSQRDRRHDLLDQIEAGLERDPLYEPVQAEGSWRATGIAPETRDWGLALRDAVFSTPRSCYRHAREAVAESGYHEDVQYVEGVALSKQATRIAGHAWIEIGSGGDGGVVELTWPWHGIDPEGTGAEYFGVPVSHDRVQEAVEKNEAGPLVLNSLGRKLG